MATANKSKSNSAAEKAAAEAAAKKAADKAEAAAEAAAATKAAADAEAAATKAAAEADAASTQAAATKTVKAPALSVTSSREGFRRGGRTWSKAATVIKVTDLTKTQLAQIQSEPRLTVTEIEISAE